MIKNIKKIVEIEREKQNKLIYIILYISEFSVLKAVKTMARCADKYVKADNYRWQFER